LLSLFAAGSLLWLGIAAASPLIPAEPLPRHGRLGVDALPQPANGEQLCGNHTGGMIIKAVQNRSTAAAAGVLAGDLLLAINDRELCTNRDLVESEHAFTAGTRLDFTLCRNGETKRLQGQMQPAPLEQSLQLEIIYQPLTTASGRWQSLITRPHSASRPNAQPLPALLVLQNWDSGSLDLGGQAENPLQRLLYHLTLNGFITMRVDRSGQGDSETAAAGELDFNSEWFGLREALRFLQGYPGVDPQRIFLLGMGSGGIIAPLLANEVPTRGIITYNTTSVFFLEQMLASYRRDRLESSTDFVAVEEEIRDWEKCLHLLLVEGKTPAEINDLQPRVATRFFDDDRLLGRHYTYWQQLAAVRPAFPWRQLTTPVLVVRGDLDPGATWEDQTYLARMLNSNHPRQATIIRLQHAGSLVRPIDRGYSGYSPNMLAGQSGDYFLSSITNWLQSLAEQE